jgi:hypothetical protein
MGFQFVMPLWLAGHMKMNSDRRNLSHSPNDRPHAHCWALPDWRIMPQQSRDLRFHDDFGGTDPCATATDGQSGRGISPPTVSCPFAPANIIGSDSCPTRSLAFEPKDAFSFGPLIAVAPIAAANKDNDSNLSLSDDFIGASGNPSRTCAP